MPRVDRQGTNTITLFLAALLAAAVLPTATVAATIFTNFGPGHSFNSGLTGVINGKDLGFVEHDGADLFQPSGTFTLASIDLAASVTSGTDSFIVEITENASGVPGSVLESFTLSNIPTSPTVETLTSILHPTLSKGAFYWIAVFPGGSDTLGDTYANNTGDIGNDFSNNGGLSWGSDIGPSDAFDILGNPVPAVPVPSAALLLASGLCGLVMFASARRKRLEASSPFGANV